MKNITLTVIHFYQKYISRSLFPGSNCRFIPTCSAYTYEAVSKYGTIKGLYLGFKRILHCHPFSSGGYNPVK